MEKIRPYGLTDLELAVLELMIEGLDDDQIALKLELKGTALQTQVQAILRKTGTVSRTAAAVKGLKAGLTSHR